MSAGTSTTSGATRIARRNGRANAPRPTPGRGRRRFDLLPYALVTPLALFIVVLALVPAAITLVEAFFKAQPLDPPNSFVGLGNFVKLFQDDTIVSSMVNTAYYVVIGVVVSTVLGIVMAVTLQKPFVGRSVLIAVLILPWALPGVVEGIVWSGIWDSNTGLLNSVLSSLHLIDHYQVFLGQNRFVTILVIEIVQVWQMTPLSTLLVLAALQNIPGELYEAASIDGATGWKSFLQVTLPLARPGIAIAMVQAIIATLNVFDQPYVLNGAASTGASVTEQTYFVSFQNLDFGEGYALSLLITIATVVVSLAVVRLVYKPVEF
ncbi:sugar ABC transporter permease [Curtobacterium sp. MCBD17_040]|uniref:carbohydrate ABC transporter permease n=1 Tax=Curtobacterium sp. MCBD17_040 TaxID=2175674 RepID=UPI000DAA2D41|nr:sugar ABC transporter permease [Curtobacterium sp. MCBD17_040]WIB64670.1 sugar ABC transporter permease [Curtobacterium sp. MCBD17_040]